jgi:hypothetical protein
MMHDLYCRAPTQFDLDAALFVAGLITAKGASTSELVCIDRIGEISRVTGYVDDEPVVETLEGYHANVRVMFDLTPEQLGDLDAVTINAPAAPYRVWA